MSKETVNYHTVITGFTSPRIPDLCLRCASSGPLRKLNKNRSILNIGKPAGKNQPNLFELKTKNKDKPVAIEYQFALCSTCDEQLRDAKEYEEGIRRKEALIALFFTLVSATAFQWMRSVQGNVYDGLLSAFFSCLPVGILGIFVWIFLSKTKIVSNRARKNLPDGLTLDDLEDWE